MFEVFSRVVLPPQLEDLQTSAVRDGARMSAMKIWPLSFSVLGLDVALGERRQLKIRASVQKKIPQKSPRSDFLASLRRWRCCCCWTQICEKWEWGGSEVHSHQSWNKKSRSFLLTFSHSSNEECKPPSENQRWATLFFRDIALLGDLFIGTLLYWDIALLGHD